MAAPVSRIACASPTVSKAWVLQQRSHSELVKCGTRCLIHKMSSPAASQAVSVNYTPVQTMCYQARKVDITAGKQTFVFDTHEFVKTLVSSGLPEGQAECIVNAMVHVMHANTDYMNRNMVTKAQQEIMMQQVMATISTIRKDMIILEKSEFSSLKHEYEKQAIELKQLRQTVQDEVIKLKSGMSLDLNLERSRAMEDHSGNERELATLQNKMDVEHMEVSKQFSVIDQKIAKEIATLVATFEKYKNDVMKFCAGSLITGLSLCVGILRLWS